LSNRVASAKRSQQFGEGTREWRHKLQRGTHRHDFELNWAESPEGVQRGHLPIAIPIADPPNFTALLEVVGKEFRIEGVGLVTAPSWEPTLL
jgi:hypothetical protein